MVGYWIHLLGIPTAVAVGMAKYGFLLLGFVLASRYLKTVFAKMALAVAWFFPLPSFHFWTSLGHPYAEHLALILSAFALMDFSFSNENTKSFGQYLAVFFAALLFMLALWISDLTMAFVPAVLLAIGLHWNRMGFELARLKNPKSIVAILCLVVGGWFLMHAKRAAFRIDEYHELFAQPEQLVDMTNMLASSLWSFLSFSRDNAFHSVTAWGMVLALIVVLAQKRKFESESQMVLLVAAVCSFGAVFVSYWANTPDPAHRHYTGIVPLVWIVF